MAGHTHTHTLTHSQAKSVKEVLLEQEGLEKVWVVHNQGFTLGTVIHDTPMRSNLSAHITLVRYQVSTEDGKGERRIVMGREKG